MQLNATLVDAGLGEAEFREAEDIEGDAPPGSHVVECLLGGEVVSVGYGVTVFEASNEAAAELLTQLQVRARVVAVTAVTVVRS